MIASDGDDTLKYVHVTLSREQYRKLRMVVADAGESANTFVRGVRMNLVEERYDELNRSGLSRK